MKTFDGYKKRNLTDKDYALLAGGGHKALDTLFSALSSDTTNAIKITVGGTEKSITTDTLKTSLGLGSNAYTSTAYLPLAGGTMTKGSHVIFPGTSTDTNYGGSIEFREVNYVTTSQTDWSYAPGITFHWGGYSVGKLGLRSDGALAWRNQIVIHSGNISSQSVNSASSTKNLIGYSQIKYKADLDAFVTGSIIKHAMYQNAKDVTEETKLGIPLDDGMVMSWGWPGNTNYAWQIAIEDDGQTNHMAIRNKSSKTWGAWRIFLTSANYNSYTPKLDGTGATGTWGINITGNANTVDNIHATGFLRWKGMQNIGSNAPFQAVVDIMKDTSKLNDGGLAFYSYAGDEYTVLIGSRNDATRHGNALKWGYANKYLWMIRMINGSPRSSDWEKISAGYADLAGALTITVAANTTDSWINFTDPDKTVKLGIRRPLANYGPTYYDGTNYYKLYHEGFKPTASDVGAVASRDFYIGTTAVQASSAAQSLNGITSINSGDNKIIIDTSQKFGPNDGYTLADHPGLRICQRNSEGGRTDETSGIMFNGNYIQMWSPADSYCIRYYDDDSGKEIWNISASAVFSGKANTSRTADVANSVAWSNVSGRPTNVSSFTNDAGYLTSHQSLANCIKNAGTNPTLGNGGAIIQPGGSAAISIRTTTGGSDVGIFYMSEDNCYICNSSDNCYTFGVFDKDLTTSMNDPNAASFCVLSNGTGCQCRGNFTAAGQFYASSDQRLKKDINNVSKSIRAFKWKDSNEKAYGLIAQELEEQGYSELVSTKSDGYKTINYNSALCMIIARLENELDELRERINQLQTPPSI